MTPYTDDLDFVERVVTGDSEAAELFLNRCQLWTGQLTRRAGLPKQEWEDIGNEALLTAFGQMQRGLFRGESSFQTWMEKIIHGKIANYWRTHGNDKSTLVPLESALDEYPRKGARDVSPIQPPVMRRPNEEIHLLVQQALRAMPRRHAMVLLLNVQEGYSTAEIGQMLNLPSGTIGRTLSEAKKKFQPFFSNQPQLSPPHETAEPAAPAARRLKQDFTDCVFPIFLSSIPAPSLSGLPNLRDVQRQSLAMLPALGVSATPSNPGSVGGKNL